MAAKKKKKMSRTTVTRDIDAEYAEAEREVKRLGRPLNIGEMPRRYVVKLGKRTLAEYNSTNARGHERDCAYAFASGYDAALAKIEGSP